jgi:HlyD family secretion protein
MQILPYHLMDAFMRRFLRWFLILAGIAVVASLTTAGIYYLPKGSGPKYLTLPVTRGRVETVVNSTGTVKPVRSVSIGAFVSGPIREIYVDFNSVVKKDELLARVDPRLLNATVARDEAFLETQKAELHRIEALLKQSERNEDRARKLAAVGKDYISGMEMDQYHFSRLSYDAQRRLALASITQAQATLANSKQNLDYTYIRSPVDGIVIDRKVDPGQTVAASFQTPELFIVAPDMDKHMHVFGSVDESDIGMIRSAYEKGRTATFTVDAYPGELFDGTIYQIRKSSTTIQNVVTYPVVIEAGNADLKLLPGMTATISFNIEAKEDVPRVPMAALRFVPLPAQVRPEDRQYLDGAAVTTAAKRSATERASQAQKRRQRVVWVEDGQYLKAVPVTLGLMDRQNAELLAGDLGEGQTLVTGFETTR